MGDPRHRLDRRHDESVYAWKLADLVATSGFWIGAYEIGEAAALQAVRNHPGDARLTRNLGFYVDRTRQQEGRK